MRFPGSDLNQHCKLHPQERYRTTRKRAKRTSRRVSFCWAVFTTVVEFQVDSRAWLASSLSDNCSLKRCPFSGQIWHEYWCWKD
ncbi:hypothetical protein GJAV_G00128160 [Gymnothorax javanicus]|nr:hypothetical protein GJAV_G00128160 [Gymnothorax javanicus]